VQHDFAILECYVLFVASSGAHTLLRTADILIDPTPATTLMDAAKIQVELEKLLGVSVDVLNPKALPDKFRGHALAEAAPV
jgi:predicted nucleotidyltransferase